MKIQHNRTQSSTGHSVVLITVPDTATADTIASRLLERKLAACVHILPAIKSRYWWEGKQETASEILLTVKTETALVPLLIRAVREIHPYKVPEIIALPVTHGNPAYLAWITDCCRRDPRA
ncbi:MAG: divalent-cation tolerance protein CutA [Elusimicrobiaceae bacterium]|nr:divalent-cation tolerance protein CutA [Elusimicrobiaceae bacterium]